MKTQLTTVKNRSQIVVVEKMTRRDAEYAVLVALDSIVRILENKKKERTIFDTVSLLEHSVETLQKLILRENIKRSTVTDCDGRIQETIPWLSEQLRGAKVLEASSLKSRATTKKNKNTKQSSTAMILSPFVTR